MSREKPHALAGVVNFSREQPIEMVEAAISLMKSELKARVGAGPLGAGTRPTAAPKIPRVKAPRPSHVPPVNEASRLSADGHLIG